MSGGMGGGEGGVSEELLTTKGDSHGYSTTNARIPVGVDGQVITADSTDSLGLGWSATAGLGANTFTGNQTINGNKIKTSLYDMYDSSFGGASGFLSTPPSGNASNSQIFKPSGTTKTCIHNLNRIDDTTNSEALVIGSDFFTPNAFQIGTWIRGTGTSRPLYFYINGVVNSVFPADNSGFGVIATKKLYLDSGNDTYIQESTANNLSLVAGGVSATLSTTNLNLGNRTLTLDGQDSAKMELLETIGLPNGWTSGVVDLSAYDWTDYSEFIFYIDSSTKSASQELRLNAKSGGTGLATLYTNSIWWDTGGTQTINTGGLTYWTLADTGSNGVFTHTGTEWKYKVSVYPNYTNGSMRWMKFEGLIGTNVPHEAMLIGQGHNATATGQNYTFEFYPSASTFGTGTIIVYGVRREV